MASQYAKCFKSLTEINHSTAVKLYLLKNKKIVAWLFPTLEDLAALSRDLKRMPPVEVDEELRGWSYGQGAVAPGGGPQVGVADVAGGFCESSRDAYLRYVARIPQRDNRVLQRGRLLHEAWTRTVSAVKKALYAAQELPSAAQLSTELRSFEAGFKESAVQRYRLLSPDAVRWLVEKVVAEAAYTYSASLERQLARSRFLELDGLASSVIPLVTEFPVDGGRVGLSRSLRLDALLLFSIPLELKTRTPRPEFEIALAGYAIALESEYEAPVDRGLLLYVEVDEERKRLFVRPKLVAIGNSLRSAFIEKRDRVKEILAYREDPGLPSRCSPECPYLHYCRGGEK